MTMTMATAKAKITAAALCVAAVCAFSGCSLPMGGTAELLKAPALNKLQNELSAALEATINLSDIIYRYPQQGGEYLTPFIFHDLDGDGVDEAVVFYSYANRSSEIRVKVLRQNESSGWYSFRDTPGQGNQIDFVDFAGILSAETPCMIIGWQDTERREKQLEIFSMRDGEFEREYSQAYSALSIADYGPGRLSQVILAARESRTAPYQLLLLGNLSGYVGQLDSLRLYEDVESILQMLRSRLWDGTAAVYIDELWDNNTVATEIVRYNQSGFSLVAGGQAGPDSPEMKYYSETFRPDRLLSVDINRDGFVMVPQSVSLPGTEESDEVTVISLTRYLKAEAGGFAVASNVVVNEPAGYLIRFPDKWLDTVTVVDNPESNQRSFHRVDPKTLLPSTELLRVTVYSTRDYERYPEEYLLLRERGVLRYFAYIPETEDEPLAITEADLKSMFSLL